MVGTTDCASRPLDEESRPSRGTRRPSGDQPSLGPARIGDSRSLCSSRSIIRCVQNGCSESLAPTERPGHRRRAWLGQNDLRRTPVLVLDARRPGYRSAAGIFGASWALPLTSCGCFAGPCLFSENTDVRSEANYRYKSADCCSEFFSRGGCGHPRAGTGKAMGGCGITLTGLR